MTGRGAGYCGGSDAPGYTSPRGYGYGRGFGMRRGGWGRRPGWRRGWGRGWGPRYAAGYAPYAFPQDPYFAAPPDAESEAAFLKTQAQALQRELDAIGKRIEELEGGEG